MLERGTAWPARLARVRPKPAGSSTRTARGRSRIEWFDWRGSDERIHGGGYDSAPLTTYAPLQRNDFGRIRHQLRAHWYLRRVERSPQNNSWGIARRTLKTLTSTDEGTPGNSDGTIMVMSLDAGTPEQEPTPSSALALGQGLHAGRSPSMRPAFTGPTRAHCPTRAMARSSRCRLRLVRHRVLASGQASPWGIAVDANNVYWVNHGSTDGSNGSVMLVGLDGGTPVVMASNPECALERLRGFVERLLDQLRRRAEYRIGDGGASRRRDTLRFGDGPRLPLGDCRGRDQRLLDQLRRQWIQRVGHEGEHRRHAPDDGCDGLGAAPRGSPWMQRTSISWSRGTSWFRVTSSFGRRSSPSRRAPLPGLKGEISLTRRPALWEIGSSCQRGDRAVVGDSAHRPR